MNKTAFAVTAVAAILGMALLETFVRACDQGPSSRLPAQASASFARR